jgi:hypothetical protein
VSSTVPDGAGHPAAADRILDGRGLLCPAIEPTIWATCRTARAVPAPGYGSPARAPTCWVRTTSRYRLGACQGCGGRGREAEGRQEGGALAAEEAGQGVRVDQGQSRRLHHSAARHGLSRGRPRHSGGQGEAARAGEVHEGVHRRHARADRLRHRVDEARARSTASRSPGKRRAFRTAAR